MLAGQTTAASLPFKPARMSGTDENLGATYSRERYQIHALLKSQTSSPP